jgi:hypothetical protein
VEVSEATQHRCGTQQRGCRVVSSIGGAGVAVHGPRCTGEAWCLSWCEVQRNCDHGDHGASSVATKDLVDKGARVDRSFLNRVS